MKKYVLSFIFLCVVSPSFACPICGCGVGGFYIGLLPGFQNKFIGTRYQYSYYNTRLADKPEQFSKDSYSIIELWGGISLGKKWQLLGFLPYHINRQNTDDGLKKSNGLGDATLLANYRLWHSAAVTKKNNSFTQNFWIGAGLKLPTGTYRVDLSDPETELGDVNSQMGTGSVDFILNAMYNVRMNKVGINTTVNYKANTTNNSNFKYGNRFTANSFLFYQVKAKQTYLAPNVGVLYEDASVNYVSKEKVKETGGYVALASAGIEANFGKINVGSNVQLPFVQQFAHGQTQAKTRCFVHITLTL